MKISASGEFDGAQADSASHAPAVMRVEPAVTMIGAAASFSASGEFNGAPGSPGWGAEHNDGGEISRICELIPLEVTDISINPYNDDWSHSDRHSFNPSIHFDGKTWLCSLRTSNYTYENGIEIKAPRSHPMVTRSRNVMLVLDPKTWKPIHIHKIEEKDGHPRNGACTSWGFEDIRLFRTAQGELRGICASLQLGTERVVTAAQSLIFGRGGEVNARGMAEQVLLTFNEQFDIVGAKPIRVPGYTRRPQKNWPPFDGLREPRFLYSIDDSAVFGVDGQIGKWGASMATTPRGTGGPGIAIGDYYNLRGSSQLIRVANDLWLGIGHDGRYVGGIKIYCHTFYTTDDTGLLTARSAPFRLRSDGGGIEFAAGLAIDGDRAVISYGIDDASSWLAETSLEAVLAMLKPTGATRDAERARLPIGR